MPKPVSPDSPTESTAREKPAFAAISISPDVSVGLRPKRPITEFCRPNQLAAQSARVFAQPVDADSARHPVIEKLASISGEHLELGKRYERYDKLN